MLIDLDRFKQVNDQYGHQMGDKVLQTAAKRMQACIRGSDLIARQGGDEFVAVLQDVEHDSTAGLIALRVIEELSRPFRFDGREASIGASVGIALLPEDGIDARTLFSRADAAMYEAKQAGRETLRFFEREMCASA
jgi:diguanylate cyclase (GGDEF)-like protein